MTTPHPRVSGTDMNLTQNAQPDVGLSLVLSTMARLDDSVTRLREDIGHKFDSLGEKFVPRPEISAKWEESARDRVEIRNMLTAASIKHDLEVEKINIRLNKAEDDRKIDRRWTIGTLLASAPLAIGVVNYYVTHK